MKKLTSSRILKLLLCLVLVGLVVTTTGKLLAASASSPSAPASATTAANAAAAPILTHGPVFGNVNGVRAYMTVRTSASASVYATYSTSTDMSHSLSSLVRATATSSDYTTTFGIFDLLPDTRYYINIYVNGVSQFSPPYPSVKTFATIGIKKPFKFIVLADFENQATVTPSMPTYDTFRNAAAENPDFAFIGGDFDHRNPLTLAGKRIMFKQLYDPASHGLTDFVNLILRGMPIVHQWDDHDAGKDNADKTYPNWPLSLQVFKEFVPSYPLPTAPNAIYQKFSYAKADFFVLDNRSQRDIATTTDDINKSMLDGNNLGANGQLEWLKSGLLASTATWKIVFSSVVTNPTTKPLDAWAAYQTEWNALRTFITSHNIGGVVFISGDLHMGAIDSGVASGVVEMVVPAPNGQVLPTKWCATGDAGQWNIGKYVGFGPCNGYGVVSVLTNPDRLLLQVKDDKGQVKVSYTVVR